MTQNSISKQHYGNYIRWYPPHHFVLLPLCLLGIIGSIYGVFYYPERRLEWIAISFAFFLIAFTALILRQHYGLNNQNRIVRLEMRLRYFQLTGKRLELIETQLGFSRIAALRFAPDGELEPLVAAALTENLSADDIKKQIKNWLPDEMRV
ncbi:MAG: DUF6526 family protein [Chitinophagaceae bacterium]